MLNTWIRRCLLIIGLFGAIAPFSLSLATTGQFESDDVSGSQANKKQTSEDLLLLYKRQQDHINNIKSYKINNSTLEQEALRYRVFSRHLDAFETLNQLSQLLIEQRKKGEESPAIMAEINTIIDQNNNGLEAGLEHLQNEFNKHYEKQERYSIESLRLYIEHLSRQDDVYTAMTQQLINQEALGLDTTQSKKNLIARLHNRAESFSGMVELVIKKREELKILIGLKTENQDLKDTFSIVTKQLAIARVSFSLTIKLLAKLDYNTTIYQHALLKLGGQITTDLLDFSILSNMLNGLLTRMKTYISAHGGEWIFKILVLIGIYYVFKSIAGVVRNLLRKSLNSQNVTLSALMKEVIVSSASRLVMTLGLFIALAQLGISLAPVLAGLGVAGFIVGFALQDTLSNFASGMMILIYRPYDVSDLVEVAGGVFGKVKSMNLVSTTILTVDNQALVIPNSKIWGDVIKNVTSQKLRRVDLVFGIGYSDDIEKTEAVLTELVSAHPMTLSTPEPIIKLNVLNDSSVDFVVRPWVKTEDYWDVYWDLTRQVKMRFDQDGISIPFPQRDVHVYPTGASIDSTD